MKNDRKERSTMQTVNVRAEWNMVHNRGVDKIHNLTFVYSYEMMRIQKAV